MYIPKLPINYTERSDELDNVITDLIHHSHPANNVTALTAALRGAGGFGKSTIANAVCAEQKIKDAFPDGIYWIDLGEKINESLLAEKINHLLGELGFDKANFTDYKDASKKLREILEKKRALIVIDDVWNGAHLEQFLQGGTHCAHLVTTRDSNTLPAGTKTIIVNSASPEQALKMLSKGLPEGEPDLLLKLSDKLWNWPLLLGLANGQLNKDISQNNASLRTAIETAISLYEKRGITAFDLKNALERNQAAGLALDISIDQLDETDRNNLIKLAIFPENTVIPLTAVRALWERTASLKESGVEALCSQFTSLSFIQHYDAENKAFRIHAVIREYLFTKLQSQQDEPQKAHGDLVEGYLEEYEINAKKWWLVPDDHYFYQHLLSHLLLAKRLISAKDLFFNYIWLKKVLSIAGILTIIRDCESIMNAISPTKNIDNIELYLMRDFFRLSAHVLGQDQRQFPSQILGRLLNIQDEYISKLVLQTKQENSFNWIIPFQPYLTQPGGLELMTLEGHASPISIIALSSDEHYLASGSDDGIVKIWDIDNCECLHTFKEHTSKIEGLAISSYGDVMMSFSSNHSLKIWDLKSGYCLTTQDLSQKGISSMEITPDGQIIILETIDGNILTWRWREHKHFHFLKKVRLKKGIKLLSINNKEIIFVSDDNSIKKWDIDKDICIYSISGHKELIIATSISTDRKRAIAVSSDFRFFAWDVDDGKQLITFKKRVKHHDIQIVDIVLSLSGKLAVCVTNDNKLSSWDVEKGKLIKVLIGHEHNVHAVAITGNEKIVVSASSDRTIRVWDILTGDCLATLRGHSDKINNLLLSNNGKRAISGAKDKNIKVWNLETAFNSQDKKKNQKDEYINQKHDNPINDILVDEQGLFAISASQDNSCKIWEIKKHKCLHTLNKHVKPINALALTANGKIIVTGSGDGTVILWDKENGNEIKTLFAHEHNSGITSLVASKDGKIIAAGTKDSVIHVKNENSQYSLRGHRLSEGKMRSNPQVQGITALALTMISDKPYSISAGSDCSIKVWDIAAHRCERTMWEHKRFVSCIAVTPDGKLSITGSYDSNLKIWDVQSGRCIRTLRGHTGPVRVLKITSDGEKVISAASDCTIRVWDIDKGICTCVLKGHTDRVNALALHLINDNWVASASKDMTLRIWDYKAGKNLATFRGDAPFYSVGFDNQSSPTTIIAGDHKGNILFLSFSAQDDA